MWRRQQQRGPRQPELKSAGGKLVKEFFHRNLDVRIVERPVDGVEQPFIELSQRTQRPDGTIRTSSFSCRMDRFTELYAKAQQVMAERRKEREQLAPGQQWHALVSTQELTEKGGKARVVKVFSDINKALEHQAKHKELALYAEPFAEKPEVGQLFDVRKGQRPDLDRQILDLQSQQEQGKKFGFGVWNDRGSTPARGMLVNYTAGKDYREMPQERRVSPLHPWEPGEPEAKRYVVYEMHDRMPGLARVVGETRVRADAVAKVKDMDHRHFENQKVLNQRDWSRQSFGPQLRRHVDQSLEP